MTNQDVINFWDWVNEERERRRLSFRAIELMTGGQPNGKLNKRAAQGQPPTLDNCRVIAQAFGVPLETVLRHANLLPEAGRPDLQEMSAIAAALTAENLAVLLAVARALLNTQQPSAVPESGYFRLLGQPRAPELHERPYTASDFDRFLLSLSAEERASLVDALGRS
jgi:hypothetical protein